jgi:hypothetical protein
MSIQIVNMNINERPTALSHVSIVMTAIQAQDPKKKRFVFDFGDTDEDDDTLGSLEPFASNAIQRSAFTGTTFDADAYLTNRRHLGHAGLKTELNSHLRQLKSQLVELINRDYADFVNLSTNLKGLDNVMTDILNPIQDMRSEVEVRDARVGLITGMERVLICAIGYSLGDAESH